MKAYNLKYLNSYLSKRCSADLQPLFCQSRDPAKEISESWAAYENMKPFTKSNDPMSTNLFIGDGSLCMTGAIFSFMTKNFSICVDPLANVEKIDSWANNKVDNFTVLNNKYQDVSEHLCDLLKNERYNIILVHSHVNASEIIKAFPSWEYMYVNPCCKYKTQILPLKVMQEEKISCVVQKFDEGILSPKNEVLIYRNNKW